MSRNAKNIFYIVVHCQGGTGTLESMRAFWRSLGWRSPGYHRWIDFDGSRHKLQPYSMPANGVKGFNRQCIDISYRGGVERKGNVFVAKDTRTAAQRVALHAEILEALNWIEDNQGDVQKVMIVGHYHFSTDQNKNGAIESWERIKECPSFDAYTEYAPIMIKENPLYNKLKLPRNR